MTSKMNQRIEQIAEMVKKSAVVADIGTDHALLPVRLIQNQTAEKVYACDNKEGPLKSAIHTIRNYQMDQKIIPILSDGFANVPDDTKTVVIAGMGYYTVESILENGRKRLPAFQQIVIQVNDNVSFLRKWISDHQYFIDDEKLIEDRSHSYIAISFTAHQGNRLSEEEIYLGPVLMRKKDPGYIQYCKRQKEIKSKLVSCKKDGDPAKNTMQKEIAMLEKITNGIF